MCKDTFWKDVVKEVLAMDLFLNDACDKHEIMT